MEQWKIIKGNIVNIYKNQAKKIESGWEWNAVWSYTDRLIKIQIAKQYLQKAIALNGELFTRFRKGVVICQKQER